MHITDGGMTVLFQGDSVTDCGRDRANGEDMGVGYAMIAAALAAASHPEDDIRFLNRGVGGDRAINLKERWQADCIDLQPDVVSILVGINDSWRAFDSNSYTSPEQFEESYRDILTRTVEATDAEIIMMEPFLLHVNADYDNFRLDLDPKIHVVRKLAREFGAILVPLDGIFAAVSTYREPTFWSLDAVHPTNAGHALIAQSWLKAVGLS